MTYEFKKWKKDKASIIPIEETYTNNDINTKDTNIADIGYRFDTPRRWLTDPSANKAIGIRDLQLKAPNSNFKVRFLLYLRAGRPRYNVGWDTDNDKYTIYNNTLNTTALRMEDNMYITKWLEIRATPANNFEEVYFSILDRLNTENIWKEVTYTALENVEGYHIIDPDAIAYERGELWTQAKEEEEINENENENTNTNTKKYDPFDLTDMEVADVTNNFYSPIPTSIRYKYNGNIGSLDHYVEGLKTIFIAKEHGKPTFIPLEDLYIKPTGSDIDSLNNIRNAEEEIIHDEAPGIFDPEVVTYGYDSPRIYKSSLLMLLDSDSMEDIENCYNFFNQPLVNNKTVSIIIDDKKYTIPFIYEDANDGTNMTLTKNNNTFNCHFKLNSNTDDNITSIELEDTAERDAINGKPKLHTNLDLNNVWDRVNLYYHASFANNRHKIIGRNGDHWDNPNKRFAVDSAAEEQFRLWFTTDGLHRILPVGSIFNVDLTFMLNTTKNTATGL